VPLAIFGLDVGSLVADALRKLVDLLVPDFAAGWATDLVTSLVAVPDVTGRGFQHVDALRQQLVGVGFGLLGLCLVAGGLQAWAAGFAQGGIRVGEVLRRTVVAAGLLAVLPMLLRTATTGTNLATAQLIQSHEVKDGLDSAFGEAFAFGAFTQGLSLGLAIPAAIGLCWFVVALLVMKAGLTALLAVLVLSSPLVLGLSPLPGAHGLLRAWTAGMVAALAVPVAWALVFSVAALLAADTLVPVGGPFAVLAKPLAAVACFWIAYKTPGFLLAAARSVGLHPSMVASAIPGPLGGRGGGGRGGRSGGTGPGGRPGPQGGNSSGSGPSGPGGRFAALANLRVGPAPLPAARAAANRATDRALARVVSVERRGSATPSQKRKNTSQRSEQRAGTSQPARTESKPQSSAAAAKAAKPGTPGPPRRTTRAPAPARTQPPGSGPKTSTRPPASPPRPDPRKPAAIGRAAPGPPKPRVPKQPASRPQPTPRPNPAPRAASSPPPPRPAPRPARTPKGV
jgi:hypothetical protein